MNKRQAAEDGEVFADAQANVRRRLRRAVRNEASRRFGGVSDEAGRTAQQNDENIDDGRMMAEHLNREQCSADRADNGMDRVPGGIEPRDLVGKKFQDVEDTGNGDDPRLPEDFERLVIRRERDPMEMNGEARGENREVKIDPGEAGEPERDAQEIESIHARNI